MPEGKLTAELVALVRAIGSTEPDPGRRNPDELARAFAHPWLRPLLLPGARSLSRLGVRLSAPTLANTMLARTRAFDAALLSALEGPTPASQVVVLGAGLDSRAWRFRERLGGATVYEVDLPGTARWKQERLRTWGGASDHVRFVGVDFAKEGFPERLRGAGLDPGARTFVLWEGVTYYLPEPAVLDTLRWAAALGAESIIAFDFAVADGALAPLDRLRARALRVGLRLATEPFLWTLEPNGVAALAESCGLALRELFAPAALGARYLPAGAASSPLFGIAVLSAPTQLRTKNSPAL